MLLDFIHASRGVVGGIFIGWLYSLSSADPGGCAQRTMHVYGASGFEKLF